MKNIKEVQRDLPEISPVSTLKFSSEPHGLKIKLSAQPGMLCGMSNKVFQHNWVIFP